MKANGDRAGRQVQSRGTGVAHIRLEVEHVEYPPPTGDRVLRLVEHLGGDLYRLHEQRHQDQERGQLTNLERATNA